MRMLVFDTALVEMDICTFVSDDSVTKTVLVAMSSLGESFVEAWEWSLDFLEGNKQAKQEEFDILKRVRNAKRKTKEKCEEREK